MGIRKVLVCGSLDDGWRVSFKTLLKRPHAPVLSAFLDAATRAIRQELSKNFVLSRDPHWHFTTPRELGERIESLETACPPAIQCAIVCVVHIGLCLE